MSEMTDKTTENLDKDRVSVTSNEKSPTSPAMKETSHMLQTFKNNIWRAAEKSPLSPGNKGSKVTPTVDSGGSESGSTPPTSPSLSSGSPATSPLKNITGLFQKKEEDKADEAPRKSKGLARSNTEPNMAKFEGAIMKRGAFLRRSLGFGKRDKDKMCRQEPLNPEKVEEEQEEEEEEEEEVWEEMEEAYTLAEIPHTPLSVMQISQLIETKKLEDAYLNLLAMRQEFQQERDQCGEDSTKELAKKEKDLNLLYEALRNKINTIVRDSNSCPSGNAELLDFISRIIQEEERRAEEPGGLPGSWMEFWREAVGEGVQLKVKSVQLEPKEQNSSWLAVHLALLGKAILEDLKNVKRKLRWSYPPSFKAFSTYVKSYHKVVGQHLMKLEGQVTEMKDLYFLLNWIINGYKSEGIMGSLSLQPEMKDESADLQLEGDFLKQLKDKYCCTVKEDMRFSLDRIIVLENEEFWSQEKDPEKEDDFPISQFHMDIWTKVKPNVVYSRNIDAQLEQKVISSILEELTQFPERYETEFKRHCSALRPQLLWTEYQITSINSFAALQQHMEGYKDACPDEVEAFRKEVKRLIVGLTQALEDQFKEDVQPYLRRMMTREWLTNNDAFKQLQKRTELLCQHCSVMKPPHAQEFASRLHYHVAREYIGQLMKKNYSCNNRRHDKAAAKIQDEWHELRELFEDMESTHEWLYAAGDYLSDIIQKNKTDIKNSLQPLVEHYPDFSKKHLDAVLYFRGLKRGRKRQAILQKLTELKKQQGSSDGDRSQVLFGDMQVPITTDCLSNLPFSCLASLWPDN